MARLRDVPDVFRRVGTVGFGKRVWQQVGEDNVFTWGAALAYSWLFAIFPFLVFLLSLVPLLPDRVKPNILEEVGQYTESLPPDAASILNTQVKNILDKPSAGGFLSFGLILTIWAASGGMQMTMSALDKAYDIEKGRPYIKQRSIAVGLTIVVATLLIAVLILLPVGTKVINWLIAQGKVFGWMKIFLNIARWALALLAMIAVLAIVYYFGPSFKQKFHAITPGAIFCIVVWLLLGAAFKLYLTKFGGAASYNKTYGAVAGAAILLLFFYIDAVVLLVGAEINSEIDFAVLGLSAGGKPGEPPPAPLPSADEPEHQALAQELVERSGAARRVMEQKQTKEHVDEAPLLSAPRRGSPVSALMLAATGVSLLVTLLRLRRRTHQLDQQTLRHASQRLRRMNNRDGRATMQEFTQHLLARRP
jgi:membrane protein